MAAFGLPRAAHIEDALPLLDVESGRVANAKPERASHGDGDIRLRNQCEGFDRRVVDLSGRVRLLDRRRDRVYPADVPDISIRFARLALQHMDGRRGGGGQTTPDVRVSMRVRMPYSDERYTAT